MTAFLLVGALWMAALPGAESYVGAHEAEAKGRYADAVKLYDICAAAGAELAPYARVRSAVSRGRAGDADGAVKVLNEIVASKDGGPWQRMAQAELAGIYERQGRHADAAALLESVVDLPIVPRFLDRYQWALIDNFIATGARSQEGYARCSRLLKEAETRTVRLDAARRLANSPDPQHRLDAVEAYLQCGETRDAKKLLLGLAPVLLVSGGQYRAQSQYLQGRILLGGKSSAWREAFEAAIANHPESPYARLSLEYLARGLFDAGQLDAAKAAFNRLANEFPGTEEAGDALWWLAGRYREDNEPMAAAAEYVRLARLCPEHKMADDALFEAGRLLGKGEDKKQALVAYEAIAQRHPYGSLTAQALYECGRLRESSGDTAGATADYGKAARLVGDFYAHRAVERLQELGIVCAAGLNVAGPGSFVRPVPLGELPDTDFPTSLREQPWFERLFFLADRGFEEAEWEAVGLLPSLSSAPDPGPYYRALADAGLTSMAAQFAEVTGWGLKDGAPTLERLRVLFPRAYWDEAVKMARETGLDPYLLLAVGRQESVFQPRVVSSSGATGVMQLMPGTAAWLARVEPAVSPEHAGNLTHPGNSLRLGAYYLLRMIERSDANLVYALASYNAGPGNVSKWKRQIPTSDMEAFLEAIPFDETRGFVKKVLGNYAAYRSLYPEADRLAAVR